MVAGGAGHDQLPLTTGAMLVAVANFLEGDAAAQPKINGFTI
jgi:hypothetical protein